MKMRDLINAVERNEQNSTSADIDEFCCELDLNQYPGWNKQFDEAVKGYWLIKWQCSDTWVGCIVYYMDDEPIAISTQSARKSSTVYEFVSLEAAAKVRNFILECLGESEFSPTIADLNEEVGLDYTVSYSSQLLVDKGMYCDRVVKVVSICHRWDDPDLKMDELFVSYADEPESIIKINTSDFKIPLHIDAACLASNYRKPTNQPL